MARKKKGQSQEDAPHIELTPARKLRQVLHLERGFYKS